MTSSGGHCNSRYTSSWNECILVTTPPPKLQEGNVFTPVSHSVHGGGVCLWVQGATRPTTLWADTPPPQIETTIEAGGTHPTGMHSCIFMSISSRLVVVSKLVVILPSLRFSHSIHSWFYTLRSQSAKNNEWKKLDPPTRIWKLLPPLPLYPRRDLWPNQTFLRRSSFADLLVISGVMLFFLRDQPPAICRSTTKTRMHSCKMRTAHFSGRLSCTHALLPAMHGPWHTFPL